MGAVDEDWVQAWLNLQCKMISGIHRGLVQLGRPECGPFTPAARWPDAATESEPLSATANAALEQRRSVFQRPADSDDDALSACVACPLLVNDQLVGVVALELDQCHDDAQKSALQLLQWGAAWLEVLVRQQTDATNHRLIAVVELMNACIDEPDLKASATATATELARILACQRVSVGIVGRRHCEVLSLSHNARFEKGSALLRNIGAAMDECMDQNRSVVFPAPELPSGPIPVCRAHAELSASGDSAALLSIPLRSHDQLIGIITLERKEAALFDASTISLCEYLGVLIGPVLDLKRQAARGLVQVASARMRSGYEALLGPGHALTKVTVPGILLLLAAMIFVSGDFRINSRSALEGRVQRVVAAPIDGYIASSEHRAGDIVREGDELATLDDRDLRLERQKISSEQSQLSREYRGAMATRDRAKAAILGAKLSQARAQLALVEAQLKRTRLLSPLDGIVVSGDLSQSLGAPVERGDLLFEIAPLDGYRVIMQVDERDVAFVTPQQQGYLALAANPEQPLEFSVSRVTPVSTVSDGINSFRVEARLVEPPEYLRPGMEGIAKIDIGERRLIWIWSRRFVNWMHLKLWRWWP